MTVMPTPPTPPSRSMTPDQFIAAADAWLAWEQQFAIWAAGLGTPGLGGGAMTGDLGIAPEVSVASAATCDIGTANSNYVAITGSTTITSLGTVTNRLKMVRFTGALTLTHNATSLILPTAANITTAAGDTALFQSDGSGNWRCINYQKADGTSVSSSPSLALLSAQYSTGNVWTPGAAGNASDIGYLGHPSNNTGVNYTLQLTDAGKQIESTSGGAITVTIPANASVSFQAGTEIDIMNRLGGGTITLAITTDTLRFVPAGTTGSRSIASAGWAKIRKITATEWWCINMANVT